MNDALTVKDRREIKARIRLLEEQVEELQWDIDDAAENDDGERWEALNDQLEYREANIDELRTLLKGGHDDGSLGPCGCNDYHYADCPTRG